jgi:uncharacterized membrane protein
MPEVTPQPEAPLRNSTAVGAAIGAAWGVLGGPPGIVAGAIVGGVIGHYWGAKIAKAVKKLTEE